ncbi:MAG: peptidylprolyl isomerase [Brevundimonas sp.]|uniref:peptidylprolyl isomerase n=1 Tax=Brevundimonas sp. TaxID=1871086 RepID=UPI002721ABA0|nr:peptidylprolyl isomerase [Brevundimonas sp.]MDO9587045.1 peptidylprolyl isomerase [Brevundimonas sp.]MDP3368421.1 peptidylprolyl isomerase [Brevundimonas sp.]MDP3656166.1 peptidylprolyl isomerase [Brevundimonas sp.]MDZ4108182.1 peptidylprolyl isomerase [Brevundimonas sp.]
MSFKTVTAAVLSTTLIGAALPAAAQAPGADWRTVAPENLLVIDTAKGRILVELEPRIAPLSVDRIRTLADSGFYDGLTFHRVVEGFMAQTGDPLGTGAGGSNLPDIAGEFQFRRGRDLGFINLVPAPTGQLGLAGSMPVFTQPDAQMMVTADFKSAAQALFCPGVAGMARSQDPDSANSQFFLMTGLNESLNGLYAPFGRVVAGLDVVRALKPGDEAANGKVADPDAMTQVRTAAAMPESRRPAVRVMVPSSPAFAARVEQVRAERGARFTVCDVQPSVEVTGG